MRHCPDFLKNKKVTLIKFLSLIHFANIYISFLNSKTVFSSINIRKNARLKSISTQNRIICLLRFHLIQFNYWAIPDVVKEWQYVSPKVAHMNQIQCKTKNFKNINHKYTLLELFGFPANNFIKEMFPKTSFL